ncbi:hypothetical protein Tco_0132831 [Tanacetum coccineum]
MAVHVKRGRDTKIPQSSGLLVKVRDEAVYKELGDRMERAATTTSSLEAKQDSGSGPRCQDTILGDVDAQTRFETTSKQFNDLPLLRDYTLGSGEDSIKLLELMALGTDCLPTAIIFEELAQMGYPTTLTIFNLVIKETIQAGQQRKDTAFSQEETQQDGQLS